ncbi:hypothetical protein [Haloimpatiens massiliensis]|uniref:hypothetical protein n=1 Tax=Haloimpatiens massiliensis TaxID=1658110 RepID=UPI001A9A694F|nr:hypothetical protein [Haloimpatiens massiliensis]
MKKVWINLKKDREILELNERYTKIYREKSLEKRFKYISEIRSKKPKTPTPKTLKS